MEYDLQERVEDALVALMKTFADSDMKLYPAYSGEILQYPCAVATAGDLMPVSEESEFYDVFQLEGATVGVLTEAADELDQSGNVLRTARERTARARSSILSGLAGRDLATRLNAVGIPGVLFSAAQVHSVSRDVDAEKRAYITLITLYMIAEPKEIDA